MVVLEGQTGTEIVINLEQIEADLGPEHTKNAYVLKYRYGCPIFKELSESKIKEKYHYAYKVGQGRELLTRQKLLDTAPNTLATCSTCKEPVCGLKKVER